MKRLPFFMFLIVFLLTAVWPVYGNISSGIGKGPGGSQNGMYPHDLARAVKDALYRPTLQTSGTGADAIEIEFYYDGRNDELGYGGSYQNPINHRTGAIVRKGSSLDEESRIIWPLFDEQGRNLRKESVLASPALTNVMEFEYSDGLGNLTSIHYPDGYVTADYTYGASTNLLTGVSVTGSGGTFNLATDLAHNPAGGLASVTFGNGFETQITPDVRNRPGNRRTHLGMDDLMDNDFTYDAFGNITDIGLDDFGYDSLNRLTSATVNGATFGYTYDSLGNILSVTKGGSPVGSFGYTNNKINALLPSGYDEDGNVIDDGVNTYVYDALNQTASITNIGGTVSYKYDALGKRISGNDGSADTVYAYLGEQLISEYNGTDYTNSIFLEGQLLAKVTDNGVDTTTVRYSHLNHLGSPVAFTDASGTVVWPEQTGATPPYEIHNYEPFGADFNDIGAPALSPQDVRYTGKLFDANTGKHYFNARYLNAVTDVSSPELPPRFLSPDIVGGNPDNPQSWNRFSQCVNNPIKYVDPDGLDSFVFYHAQHFEKQAEAQVQVLQDKFGSPVQIFPIYSADDLLSCMESAESLSSTGAVEGLTIITHGDLEGIYFGLRSEGNVTGFTKASKGETGQSYHQISELYIPESTLELDLFTCRSATGCVGQEFSNLTGAEIYGWDGRLTFDSHTFLPQEKFSGSNWKDTLLDFNYPDYLTKIE